MSEAEHSSAFERGDALDHFIVVDQLGAGGMGLVLSAYDPDLHRKVAIKVLATELADDSASTRLLREARAMAKLSHPNVATVYEVGIVDDHVYIAMELLDGGTLGEWIESEERATSELLAAFAGAGQGLAAAHAAGLIHRDFKPNNVMVGADGRVRVLDFGLARPVPEQTDARVDIDETAEPTPHDETLTRRGAIVGTPAYMSPEQCRGQAVDERSDQFSFCVALYEAFYGSRPFDRKALLDLDEAAVTAALKRSATRELPGHVRAVLARGLGPLRRDRFAHMEQLLTALRPPSRSRVRYLGLASVAVIVGLVGLAAWAQRSASRDECPLATARLARVWDQPRQTAMAAGFRATNRPYADETFSEVKVSLDRYTSRWLAARRDACAATYLRKEQSPRLLDLRVQCLDRRLAVVSSLTALFADEPTGAIVDRAREAVARLPPLDYCSDASALTAIVPPPADPAVRAEVVAVRAVIDNVRAAEHAGAYRRGLALLQPMIARAAATRYDPVVAEVTYLRGILLAEAGDVAAAEPVLRRAGLVGARAKLDITAVNAWLRVVGILSESGKFSEAFALVPLLRALLERGHTSTIVRARYWDLVGLVHSRNGDYKTARTYHQRALAMARESVGEGDYEYGLILNHLGLNSWRIGELDEALTLLQQKLRLDTSLFGSRHPNVARGLNNVGLVHKSRGHFKQAREYFLRAIKVVDGSVGSDHILAALPHENLGRILSETGEYAAARAHHQRALDIRIKAYGRGHLLVARSLEGVGGVYWYEGKIEKAVPYYKEVLAIRRAKLRPGHPRIAASISDLGGLLGMQNKLAEALGYFEQALTLREKALGPTHRDVAFTLTNIGECLVGLKRYAEAVRKLDRALAIHRGAQHDPAALADTTNQLSRALWALGRKKRAKTLARETRQIYTAAGKRRRAELTDLERWMKARTLL